jgi:hypothetical protein
VLENKKDLNTSGLEIFLAEEQGFEPRVPFGTTVFKTAAFNRSAIPPQYVSGHLKDLEFPCLTECNTRTPK